MTCKGGGKMDFKSLIDLAINNLFATIIIVVVTILIIRRLYKNAKMYLAAKSYVKSSLKLDKKKFNGLLLLERVQKKRKRNTNSFGKLRGRAKKWVRAYFTHKVEEFPVFARYSQSKFTKRGKAKFFLLVQTGGKKVRKINMKSGTKSIIDLTNEFDCLNEMIEFLHYLPEKILNQEEYTEYAGFGEQEIILSYLIK